jgi:hypothetical protein
MISLRRASITQSLTFVLFMLDTSTGCGWGDPVSRHPSFLGKDWRRLRAETTMTLARMAQEPRDGPLGLRRASAESKRKKCIYQGLKGAPAKERNG